MTTQNSKPRKTKTFVLDTNILLHEPSAINNFAHHNVVIPITVLEELDNFKKNQDDVGQASREVTRTLDTIFPNKDAIDKGYTKPQGGTVRIGMEYEPNLILTEDKADNRILGCAMAIQKAEKIKSSVILVTKDVNLRVKARALGVRASDLKKDRELTQAVVEQTGGTQIIKVPEGTVEELYKCEEIEIKGAKVDNYAYVILEEASGKTAPAKHLDGDRFRQLYAPAQVNIREGRAIKPRNTEQKFLLDALFDPEVAVVTVFGQAGTGKTLLAIAAGLGLVESGQYEKLVITRAIVPMGREIGFLPGSEEEKMRPWVQPCYDALDFIYTKGQAKKEKNERFKNKPQRADQKHTQEKQFSAQKPQDVLAKAGKLEIEVLTTIRGRSMPNIFFVVDEAQQLSLLHAKCTITRMSSNSKIILLGDPDQIDDPYLDKYSNGLVRAATRFEGQRIHAHVTLTKGERSELAEMGAKLL